MKQIAKLEIGARPPALLVSVRSSGEALAALAGGADVIDIKEPARGALGAADHSIMESILAAVAGRRPVTAAFGELHDRDATEANDPLPIPIGLSLVKFGLARLSRVEEVVALANGVARRMPDTVGMVLCAYADRASCAGPAIADSLAAAIELGHDYLLIDTFDKSSGDLFSHVEPDELAQLAQQAKVAGIGIVLAGRLTVDGVALAARLGAAIIGVRGAACAGGRLGELGERRVRELRLRLSS